MFLVNGRVIYLFEISLKVFDKLNMDLFFDVENSDVCDVVKDDVFFFENDFILFLNDKEDKLFLCDEVRLWYF